MAKETELARDLMRAARRFGADVKVSIPAKRGRSRPSRVTGELGRKLASLRDDYGMTLSQMADLLGKRLGTTISAPTVHTWMHGVRPRKIPHEALDLAIEAIMEEHDAVEGGAWVPGEEVQATVNRWLEQLTPRQIAVAADEAVTTIRSWGTGRHRVLREKWNRVAPRVEAMIEMLPDHER